MARRGWGGSIATAIGVAAGAGAAQLGFGYGLGIINWAPADAGAAPAAWVASLVWATWIAATSTILGAACAYRLHERARAAGARPPDPAPEPAGSAAADASAVDAGPVADQPAAPARSGDGDGGGRLWQAGLAVAGGFGALVTVLLIAVPARVATAPDTATPQRVAAGYAAIGVLIGVLTAVWALRSRAAARNVVATAAWLWLLAVIAVVDSVLAGRGLTNAQLGIWQISADRPGFWIRDYLYWPGAALSLGSALVIGVLAARRTARSAQRRVGVTASGAAGPLLVAVAYLLAVPRLSAISPEQVSAHLIAPYAVIVGVGGSVLVTALAERAGRRSESRVPPVESPATAEPAEATSPAGDAGPGATAGGPASSGSVGETGVPGEAVPSGRRSGGMPARGRKAGAAGAETGVPASSTGAGSGSGAPGPRVPAPRTGEADRLEPADATGAAAADAAPSKRDTPSGRPGRSARRPE